MGRHREDPTRKTFSFDPTTYNTWQKIVSSRGIKFSDRFEEFMLKDIEEYNRNKATAAATTVNRSAISSAVSQYNNPISDNNNNAVDDNERIEEIKTSLKTNLQPLIDSRSYKALHDIRPIFSKYNDLIYHVIKPGAPERSIITKHNKLEQERLRQLALAKRYRECKEKRTIPDDDVSTEVGLTELMKVAESDSRNHRRRELEDNHNHKNNTGKGDMPSDEEGIITETEDD